MANIVQHYGTWLKKHARELGLSRLDTLTLNGFKPNPYTLENDLQGSPIKRAQTYAAEIVLCGDFDCDAVHLVLLDAKGMDGNTVYRVFRKLIKTS